jgi:DNA-binding IclR family transcriptional regulator
MMAESVDKDWGLRELSELLRIPPSAVHRVLSLLQAEGLVQRDADSGRSRVSLEFLRLGWRVALSAPITRTALPVMHSLVSRCNETVFLGLYDRARLEMVLAACVESPHPLRYVVRLHEWVPIHAGASGLAIMAFLPEAERQAIISRTALRPLTERTITEPQELERELARTRRRGYAFSRSQRIPGAVGLAAPVFGPGSRVVGDLILTIPEHRFSGKNEPSLAELLREHATRLALAIGGLGDGQTAEITAEPQDFQLAARASPPQSRGKARVSRGRR